MDFALSKEHALLRDEVRRFVNEKIRGEFARRLDEGQYELIDEIWDDLRAMDLFAIGVPEEYNGAGEDLIAEVIVNEELARGSAAVAMAYGSAGGFFTRVIVQNGTPEQKRFFLPAMAKGELRFAIAVTEPGGGTDVLGALRTFARQENGDFIVNGQKIFITNADRSDFMVTLVKTDENPIKKTLGFSLLLIPTDSKGITINRIQKFTIKGATACEVFLDEVRVSSRYLLGEIHKGWYALLKTLNHERVVVAAICNGIAMAALEDMVKYAKERCAFGRPIGQYQAIQHKVADSAIELETARLLTLKAAWLLQQGQTAHVESAMAKLWSSETAFKVATRGLDVLAGYGTTLDYDMQRYFRDSRQCTFSPISNEMVRNLIAESYGLPRSY